MAHLTARLADLPDIPQLVELMHEFYDEAAVPLDRGWAAEAFGNLLAHPDQGAAWLIERDGIPIGHAVLSVRFTMEFGGLSGYIDDLFVRPGSRRLGAARTGLDALRSEARRRGCRSLQVEVGADNHAALALYRQYGMLPGADNRVMLHVTLAEAG